MLKLLYSIGPISVTALIILTITVTIFIFRKKVLRHKKGVIATDGLPEYLHKKYIDVDINSYKTIMFELGLVFSLWIVYTLMEFPIKKNLELVNLNIFQQESIDESIVIPPTVQLPPPPPTIKSPIIITVANEVETKEELEIDLSMDFEEDLAVKEIINHPEEEIISEEETIDEIFNIVEETASPEGGMITFYQFMGKHINYPSKARRLRVEGKVFVNFIIGKDGSLTDIHVVKGIGAGCDEEAIRIIQKSPPWKPGKQRGRAVKQRMTIPIHFKLK